MTEKCETCGKTWRGHDQRCPDNPVTPRAPVRKWPECICFTHSCYVKAQGAQVTLPLKLGTKTKWGKITAVGMENGERFYMMTENKVVSLMPGDVVEKAQEGA